jgi:hypothetical protein
MPWRPRVPVKVAEPHAHVVVNRAWDGYSETHAEDGVRHSQHVQVAIS